MVSLYSMTGFGAAQNKSNGTVVKVEIKSLNGKIADARMRIPSRIKDREIEIKNLVISRAIRGKLDLSIDVLINGLAESYQINEHLVEAYFSSLSRLSKKLDISGGDLMQTIMRLPNVVALQEDSVDDQEWQMIRKTILSALDQLMEFRKREGQSLFKELKSRVQSIMETLAQVDRLEAERMLRIKQKLSRGLDAISDHIKIDQNRYEQELIYYMEKLDITEEKVRLKEHCSYFVQLLHDDTPEKGRKLGFLSQEIGREINTLGSKAQFAPLQRLVIDMKDELEKIKEQSLNVL